MLVHAVFEIPDGTVIDDRLPAQVSYNAFEEDGVCGHNVEGFLEPVPNLLSEDFKATVEDVKEGQVILFKYPADVSSAFDVQSTLNLLKAEFPNNKVLGIANDVELLIQDADNAVNMLNQMIAHIKLASGSTGKIILQ